MEVEGEDQGLGPKEMDTRNKQEKAERGNSGTESTRAKSKPLWDRPVEGQWQVSQRQKPW